MKSLKELTRPNIWALKPYSSARDEYSGKEASVFLDANENPYNTPNNRYPDPLQRELKDMIALVKKVTPEQIFLGNGSDEAIDLVFRAFCRPGIDNVVAIDPTYGMYQVCADVNDVEYRKVLLDDTFQFKADELLAASDENTKLIFTQKREARALPLRLRIWQELTRLRGTMAFLSPTTSLTQTPQSRATFLGRSA
jgi:histidinol-phosphate aminotransferase